MDQVVQDRVFEGAGGEAGLLTGGGDGQFMVAVAVELEGAGAAVEEDVQVVWGEGEGAYAGRVIVVAEELHKPDARLQRLPGVPDQVGSR
ncbi:hypothetical protein [Streptomyces sp. NBC_01205]|uniref:hypothetical protein n=1 Tax=Streptomyces sp. NBC_01205 TaxID=2903771 RepID=UPI002E0DA068|nr:hypothetical protein OG573_35150 [Streptomyces sp. NBC_01205]